MIGEHIVLHCHAEQKREIDDCRSLAALPCVDVKSGVTFVPADSCGLKHCTLALTVGMGLREDCMLDIRIGPDYHERFDASYVSAGQRLRIPLSPAATVLLNQFDVDIEASCSLWIIAENTEFPYLSPCIASSQEAQEPLRRLCDSAIAPFGWMYGCVADALLALYQATGQAHYKQHLERQLACFLTDRGLRYANPRNIIDENDFHSIELTLPFAVISQLDPHHPSIDYAIKFLRSRRREDGLIYDGASITTEGCYTIAYPLMQIGVLRNDHQLQEWSWQQLAIRREALFQHKHFYLRNYEGKLSFEDWSRGVCWYFLGHVRTIIASGVEPDDEMRAHLQEVAAIVAAAQNARGLWYNFWSQADMPIDSSGSAGMSCALALAAQRGWIDKGYRQNAEKCLRAITEDHLVDGGFVNCVGPNNKRGEEHQRRELRTCEPLALGLFGQLHAALINE